MVTQQEDPIAPEIDPDLGPGLDTTPSPKTYDPRQDGAQFDDSDPTAIKDAEENPDDSGGYDPDNIQGREQFTDPHSRFNGGSGKTSKEADDIPFKDDEKKKETRRSVAAALIRNRKKLAGGATGLAAIVAILGSIFTSFGALNLGNFMANVEQKGFARYQVDTRGRSSKWLQTYIMLRFGEVENPSLQPRDRDNILFRSNRVDNNKPLTDWYKTMRASKFEDDLYEKHGIKFGSVAYQDGNIIKFRPVRITTGYDHVKSINFSVTGAEIGALRDGDINGFNNRLRDFVVVHEYGSDKEARAAIAQALKERYPGWWRAIKRYHLRVDIQNMIGVRSWRIFENKRNELKENRQNRRNAIVKRVVDNALPDNSKSGKFIECLFGLANCSASGDVANPENQALTGDGTQKEPDKTTKANPNDPHSPDVAVNGGTGEADIKEGVKSAGKAGESIRKAIPKLFKGANALSMIDSLSKFDAAVKGHKLSKLVVQAKGQYVVGLYTTLKIADDQAKTGQMSSQEFGDFMDQYGNMANGEGWTTVVNPSSSTGTVSAASTTYSPPKDKQEFCSEKHQEEMAKPENKQLAENEFQWHCPKDEIGGKNNAGFLENIWNNGPGLLLHPILAAFHAATGSIFGIIDSVSGAVSGAFLSLTGLNKTVEDVAGYGAEKAIEIGGADLNVNSQTPSGRVGNLALEGSSTLAEATMRDQGGASTNPATAALATKNYLAYQADQQRTMGFSERYLALSNPQSLLSRQVLGIGSFLHGNLFGGVSHIFGSALKSPLATFSLPAHAAPNDDGYAAARFAKIDTTDLPKECLDTPPIDMTPQNSTNADELGLFTPQELNWDLMSDKKTWFKELYAKIKDKGSSEDVALTVWNCALFDNTIKGGIGAQYGYKGVGAYGGGGDSASSTSDSAPPNPVAVPGDSQSIAKQLIDSGKLTDQDGRYIAQIKAVSQGDFSCNVNPSILKMLFGVVVKDGHKLVISSLNRKCTGVLTASGTSSFHYASSGGHAVDAVGIDGAAVTGSGSATIKYLESASKYLPTKTGYGQVESCHSGFKIPEGSYPVPDQCNHQHIEVPVLQLK